MADVLIFGAHPDDIEFWMGGTALRFTKQGYRVVYVVLTKGEAGTRGTPERRVLETKAAAKCVGAVLEQLDLKDCHIEDTTANRMLFAQLIRKYRPKLVFAPYFEHKTAHNEGRSHPDHIATGLIARSAIRFAKFKGLDLGLPAHRADHLIYYMLPRDIKPTCVVDITRFMKEWGSCCKKHKTQATSGLMKRLKLYRSMYGQQIKVPFAEAFRMEDPFSMSFEHVFLKKPKFHRK